MASGSSGRSSSSSVSLTKALLIRSPSPGPTQQGLAHQRPDGTARSAIENFTGETDCVAEQSGCKLSVPLAQASLDSRRGEGSVDRFGVVPKMPFLSTGGRAVRL